jgi:hypothetical protein
MSETSAVVQVDLPAEREAPRYYVGVGAATHRVTR